MSEKIHRLVAVSYTHLDVYKRQIHVFNVRSSHLSAFSRDIGRNKYLWGAVGISAALMLLVLFVPFLSGVFSVVALTAMQWLVAVSYTHRDVYKRQGLDVTQHDAQHGTYHDGPVEVRMTIKTV